MGLVKTRHTCTHPCTHTYTLLSLNSLSPRGEEKYTAQIQCIWLVTNEGGSCIHKRTLWFIPSYSTRALSLRASVVQWLAHLTTNPLARVRSRTKAVGMDVTVAPVSQHNKLISNTGSETYVTGDELRAATVFAPTLHFTSLSLHLI